MGCGFASCDVISQSVSGISNSETVCWRFQKLPDFLPYRLFRFILASTTAAAKFSCSYALKTLACISLSYGHGNGIARKDSGGSD